MGRERVQLVAYFLLTSGSLFPLQYLPIKYEWLSLFGTAALMILVWLRFGFDFPKSLKLPAGFLIGALSFQIIHIMLWDNSAINWMQVFRGGLYGFTIFLVAISALSRGLLSEKAVLRCANVALTVLFVLSIASVLTGLQLYATSFASDISDGDLTQRVAAGGYRIIPFYAAFLVFLYFYNLIQYLNHRDRTFLKFVFMSFILIMLTGTRSIIMPSILVTLAIFAVRAKIGKTIGLIVFVAAFSAIFSLLFPSVTEAFVGRFFVASLFDSWRALEQHLAWISISQHPLFGIPVGAPYTNVMSTMSGEAYARNADYDIHNEYLWYMIYYGYAGVTLVAGGIISTAWAIWRNCKNRDIRAAFFCYLVVMLIEGLYSAALLRGYGGLWFGVITGLSIRRVHASVERPSPLDRDPLSPKTAHASRASALRGGHFKRLSTWR